MDYSSEIRNDRIICVPFSEDDYDALINDAARFGAYIDSMTDRFPELFPLEISSGWLMKDICISRKPSLPIRRIGISGTAHTIRPSFVMPYT